MVKAKLIHFHERVYYKDDSGRFHDRIACGCRDFRFTKEEFRTMEPVVVTCKGCMNTKAWAKSL